MATPRVVSDDSARAAFAELLKEGSPVLDLAARFRTASHELYLVGGPVRDAFLGRAVRDLDFATDAHPEDTLEIVRGLAEATWFQGMKFGTVGARIAGVRMEITTFRSERYEPASRHPEVSFGSSIEADLSRRDFRVNAMALRLPDKELVDPFNGLADLPKRILRTPIEPRRSFADDPLRMLRAFRFAAQLGFDVDGSALQAIEELREDLKTVSAERIRDELSLTVTAPNLAAALEPAVDTGLTDTFLPELSALKLEQDPVHRHKDVFHHTLAVAERTEADLVLRLAAVLHDIGKPKTRRVGAEGVSFHHHEVVGAEMAKARLQALRYPNEIVSRVSEIIRLHHRFHTYRLGWSDSAVRRYVRDAGPLLPTLNALVRADCTTRNRAKATELGRRMDELEHRIADLRQHEELAAIRPELDGHQVMVFLGTPPGPIVGRALQFLLDLRLDEGPLGEDVAYERLDSWARANGISPVGERVTQKGDEE